MAIILNCTESAIKDAATSLISGNLVAFPTETVYGLGADATNEDAIARIYTVKGRPTGHPIIVHISSMAHLDKWAREIPEYAIKLARSFWPGPMTLILPRTGLAKDFITGGQDNVGIRIPSHSIALALIKEFEDQGGLGVAAPSANRFGQVSPTNVRHVEIELSNYLTPKDIILDGGQSLVGVESTIIDCTQSAPTILRPGRVTPTMVNDLLDTAISIKLKSKNSKIKAPGSFESHYAPKAKVYLSGSPNHGDGFLALNSYPTPEGSIRLANPQNNEEYARVLYQALHLADTMKLDKVFVIPPEGDDVAVAIYDRLLKSETKY